jgi:hypothetical protein
MPYFFSTWNREWFWFGAAAAVVVYLVATIYSRYRRRRRGLLAGDEPRETDGLLAAGATLAVNDAYGDGDVTWFAAAAGDSSCVRCGGAPPRDVASPRYLLLGCRCEWCGCHAAQGASPSQRYNRSSCERCGSAVQTVVDLHRLYLEIDPDSAHAPPQTSARSFGRFHSTVFDAPDCCICMAEPSTVALLPCGHLAGCNGCTRVLVANATNYRGADGVMVTGSRCPLCRSAIAGLLELNDDQLATAVRSAAKR